MEELNLLLRTYTPLTTKYKNYTIPTTLIVIFMLVSNFNEKDIDKQLYVVLHIVCVSIDSRPIYIRTSMPIKKIEKRESAPYASSLRSSLRW